MPPLVVGEVSPTWSSGAASLPPDAAVFTISAAAELAGMHPQTLRQYDRLGLVTPSRTGGGGRRYSVRDISRLQQVQRLSQEDGVNLAGIKRILELENENDELRAQAQQLSAMLDEARAGSLGGDFRRTYLPAVRESSLTAIVEEGAVTASSGAIVVWKPHRRGRQKSQD